MFSFLLRLGITRLVILNFKTHCNYSASSLWTASDFFLSHLRRKLKNPFPLTGRGAISIGTWFLCVTFIYELVVTQLVVDDDVKEFVFMSRNLWFDCV